MELKNQKELMNIIEKYKGRSDYLAATYAFVKEFINPQPDRYDMRYRYEHTLRVAYWGKQIAEGEGWDTEPLVIACLLHDIGYPLCKDMEELRNHHAISAEVARVFLDKINYDDEWSKSIVRAIAWHNVWNEVPEGATAFELSVRDADDLDRFDVMRMCLVGNSDIGERSAEEIVERCDKRIGSYEDGLKRGCATVTAENFWKNSLTFRIKVFGELKRQMSESVEMEKYFSVL